MDTKIDIHLTDMAQALSRDYSGAYRKELLTQAKVYKNELQNQPFPGIKQALQHVETILAME